MDALDKQVLVVEDQYASMEKICRQMEGLDDLIILRAQIVRLHTGMPWNTG